MKEESRKYLEKERDRLTSAIAAATWSIYNIDSDSDRAELLSHRNHLAKAKAMIDLVIGTKANAFGYTDRFYVSAKKHLPQKVFDKLCKEALTDDPFKAANCGVGDLLSENNLSRLFEAAKQATRKP